MIVGGEESFRMDATVFVYMLHDGPGYRNAVVGRSTASELVEEYQRPLAHVVENRGRLVHLDHESRLSERDIIARAHTGENFVDNAYVRAVSCHETADPGGSTFSAV